MLLTILTPTYNREDLLSKCYLSLCNQSHKDFEWLIIDDGSTDNTSSLVNKFMQENIIKIRYVKKNNGGKHTAVNMGIKQANGDLTIILDSDDILTENAVETIKKIYGKYKDNSNICSFSFLKANFQGTVIGTYYPEEEILSNYIDMRVNREIKGDKSEVFITKVLNRYEYPVFEDEKFMGESYLWIKIGSHYNTIYINKVIYLAEYLENGMSDLGRRLRISCPKGGIEHTKEFLKYKITFQQKAKYSLLYVTYSFFDGKNINEIINNSNAKIVVCVNILNGYLLYRYWKYKYELN